MGIKCNGRDLFSISKEVGKQIYLGCDILVATPLRLIEMTKNSDIGLSHCSFLVMDESDRLLDSDFAKQTGAIIQQLPAKDQRTTVMFSATYNKKVDGLVEKFLKIDHVKLTITRALPAKLSQKFYWVEENDKYGKLLGVLNKLFKIETSKIIIFANNKSTCNNLKAQLENNNYNCLLFHADVSGPRVNILDDFKNGKIQILIASDALARGIDVEDVTHVINYDTPEAQQNYRHRVGRTARMGRKGTSITFVNDLTKIIVDLYDLVDGQGDLPQEMIALVEEKKKKERMFQTRNKGRSQLKAFTSGYFGEGSQYFSENPDMYTQEIETYNEVEIRTHDPEYYEE
uniref:RNA helicase n=1 Tax=Meloidogyne javanica TaxID=6303 RepID=A0A915LKB1_MELJA